MTLNSESILSINTYFDCFALPIRCFKSEEGIDLHGGGLCCNNIWIKESACSPYTLAPYEFDSNDAQYVDEDVVFLGYMSQVWGHAITDCMKHLWWFHTEEYLEKHKEKAIYYWGPKPLAGNFLELVRLAGVNVSRLKYIDKIYLFRSIIVPDISFDCSNNWVSKEYLDTIELIISNIKPVFVKGYDKLFLSEHESRRLWGVKSIEKVAISAGFKVYYPGDHPLREQISVFRSAKEILSFESSVGHNTVFCRPRIKLTMLRKENYINRYQPIINKLREFEVTIVDASLSIMNDKRYPYAGPFFVYPNDDVCQTIIPLGSRSGSCISSHALSLKKQRHAFLFPKKAFKQYIEYNLWGDEDALAHKFIYSETQAKRIAQEITKYRVAVQSQIGKIFSFAPLPTSIKKRVITKISKYLVRHFI